MDVNIFTKPSNIFENKEFQWYLVQYDKGPHKFIRKIVRSYEILWNETIRIPFETNGSEQKEHVLIRDQDQIFLGYIIHKAIYKQDAIYQHKFIELICMQLLYSSYEFSDIVQQLHFNHDFWILVMYTTETVKAMTMNGEQSIFSIFHKNEVILKKESYGNHIVAYIQEQDSTHKGVVIKVTKDLSDLVFMLNFIKNDVIKTVNGNTFLAQRNKNQKMYEEIKKLEQRMQHESKVLLQALQVVEQSKTKMQQRLIYLKNFVKLNIEMVENNIDNN